jgi:arylsulfatase A-like enzyme
MRILLPGLPAALLHFAVALAVQAQLLVAHVGPAPGRVALLPLLWLEIAAVSLGIGAVVALSWRFLPLRLLALAGALVLTALVAGDPIVFGLSGNHLSLSVTEGAFPALGHMRDSALAEATSATWVIAVAAALGFPLVHLPAVRAVIARKALAVAEALGRRWDLTAPALVVWACASLVATSRSDVAILARHPLVSLVLSARGEGVAAPPPQSGEPPRPPPPALPPAPVSCRGDLDVHALRFGSPQPAPDFTEVREAAARSRRPPNLVLIVLESVGSIQMLSGGLPRAEQTPRLAALAPRAQIFDSLYNLFPGTPRSHVALATGGRTVTWGAIADELQAKYTGPTLAGELRRAGYLTALVSAQGLDFENLGDFYRAMPWQYHVDPDSSEDAALKRAQVNSWGIDEAVARDLALAWVRRTRKDGAPGEPFFLQFLSSATHHPYAVPAGYRSPRQGDDRIDRYVAALRSTDQIIGELLDGLAAMGVLDDTVVAVLGDHGEAFGDRHPGNFAHQSFLFEENVKNFLFVLDPRSPTGHVSAQIGSLGDVAPTLLALLRPPPPDMPGRDLLARDYAQRIRYFHTNASPARWGLRDGAWKFVSSPVPDGSSDELYDLDHDPGETRNVVAEHPDHVAVYACLLRRWYIDTNEDYLDHLQGFAVRAGARPRESDVVTPGPRAVIFGRREGEERFVRRAGFHPWERVVAFSEWSPAHDVQRPTFVWTSPSGATRLQRFAVEAYSSRVWLPYEGPLPLAAGTWTLSIRDREEGPDRLKGSFVVDPSSPGPAARPGAPRDVKIAVRIVGSEIDLEVRYASDPGTPSHEIYRMSFETVGPDGRRDRLEGLVSEPPVRIRLPVRAPLADGAWQFRALSPGGGELASESFTLGKAPPPKPAPSPRRGR